MNFENRAALLEVYGKENYTKTKEMHSRDTTVLIDLL